MTKPANVVAFPVPSNLPSVKIERLEVRMEALHEKVTSLAKLLDSADLQPASSSSKVHSGLYLVAR